VSVYKGDDVAEAGNLLMMVPRAKDGGQKGGQLEVARSPTAGL